MPATGIERTSSPSPHLSPAVNMIQDPSSAGPSYGRSWLSEAHERRRSNLLLAVCRVFCWCAPHRYRMGPVIAFPITNPDQRPGCLLRSRDNRGPVKGGVMCLAADGSPPPRYLSLLFTGVLSPTLAGHPNLAYPRQLLLS
ncbi:hypothetical protein LY78DRAFT_205501 [Colletotrichum sublineola]|nr:hypothetical protein LY78DRAFT_205501 [Colletotrichum sublineola]